MPTISGVGKRSPTSTTTIRPSYSTTVMFLPISPSPPRGSTRSDELTRPRGRAGRARREEERLEHVLQRRVDLGAALGLIHHSPHLAADNVAGHEDPARAA